ncbi:hypothetical protein [Amycolatopsis sp. GA6-003]|uniref:hypothetical protein n=1 Tax=Amycolatopsis sp. GA6-003 TaxID=2652444 RepID=UPI003916F20D
MRNWTKLGLRAALVAGGLLMLGTGIASADENVNPDLPASPLDLHADPAAVASLAERLQQLAPAHLDKAASVPSAVREVVPKVQAMSNGVLTPQSASSVFTVPAQLLRSSPAASASFDEPEINAPVGNELKVTDLPTLPLLTELQNSVPRPAGATITPVNGDLPALPLPLHGGVSTTPDAPGEGHLANVPNVPVAPAAPVAPVRPVTPQTPQLPRTPAMSPMPGIPSAAVPGRGGRADVPNQGSPLAGIPLLGQLPLIDSVLPTRLLNRPDSVKLPLVPQLQRMPLDGGTSPFSGDEVTPQSAVQKLAARLSGLVRK